MKRYGKLISLVCIMAVLLVALVSCSGNDSAAGEGAAAGGDNTLVVFNYGDYIDLETLDMFTEETGIKVQYEQYVTPEDM